MHRQINSNNTTHRPAAGTRVAILTPARAVTCGLLLAVMLPANRAEAGQNAPSAPVNLRIATGNPPPPPPVASAYYGVALNGDDLANTTVGEEAQTVSYRFVARHTGSLKQVRVYLMFGQPGYWAGTGGALKLDVYEDNGSGSPGGPVLGTALLASAASNGFFPVITFSTAPALVDGKLYHIVWTNPDPSPTVNFVSVNAMMKTPTSGQRNPTMDDMDFAELHRFGTGAWSIRPGYSPIMELTYGDNFAHGLGYMEIFGFHSISGGAAVRETFTVSGSSVSASQVSVRVQRDSGSSPLTVRLERADGTLVEQGTIPAASIGSSLTWVTLDLASNPSLAAGQSYNLVLSAPSGTSYSTHAVRDGTDFGFTRATVFTDGFAQFTTGSSWVGWDMWGQTNRKDGDLFFYFTRAQ